MREVWVVEYSEDQGCFHIDTLEHILEKNRSAILRGVFPQYVPVGYANGSEEAAELARNLRLLLPVSIQPLL